MNKDPETDRCIRVLYCILDNRFGGPHSLALTMARALRPQGVETTFLTGRKSAETWQPDGFASFCVPHLQCISRNRPVSNLCRFLLCLGGTLAHLRGLLRTRRIDVVHVDGVTNVLPAIAARQCGVPVVWTYNDHPPWTLEPMLLRLVARFADRVIVQGEALKQVRTAGRTGLQDKTEVVYSAVDTSRMAPERPDPLGLKGRSSSRAILQRELGLATDCLLVGTVGNLNRYKGHTYLLEAAARVCRDVDTARFLVVGRTLGTDAGYWQQLQRQTARLGLSDQVVFAGFREDIRTVLSALDVFVLPSVLESCPVVALEAMAMELPVVATDVGAVAELVAHEQTGLVVPARRAAALAEALLTVLRMPADARRRMGRAGRKRVEQRFGADKIAVRQLSMYESLCQRSGRPA
jgi:glycosyltransferase involved in cell wall biosynthesis